MFSSWKKYLYHQKIVRCKIHLSEIHYKQKLQRKMFITWRKRNKKQLEDVSIRLN